MWPRSSSLSVRRLICQGFRDRGRFPPLSAAARCEAPKPSADPNLSESRLDARLRQGAPNLVRKRFAGRFPLRRSICELGSELGSESGPEAGTPPQQWNPASSYT